MEKNNTGDNLSTGRFQQAVDQLGISSDKINPERLQTSPFTKLVTDDSDTSIIRPVKVAFDNVAQRDSFLSFANYSNDNFPMEVITFSANDVVVTAQNPLVIGPSGTNPVIVNIGTLTIETGGQIECLTSVIMNVTTFIKQ
jgi:hypothetical protein